MSFSLSFSKPKSLVMAFKDSSVDDMVKAVSSKSAYNVLTKEEYNILVLKMQGEVPKRLTLRRISLRVLGPNYYL